MSRFVSRTGAAPPTSASTGRGLLLCLAALAACSPAGSEGEPPVRGGASAAAEWADLRYAIRLLPSPPDRVRARATLRNVGPGHRSQTMPFCLVWLRFYRGGGLVYDAGAEAGCGGAVRVVELRRGEEATFRGAVSADEVLGDGREPGRYLVRAYIPGSDRPGLPRAEMELTLGEVELRPD